ncbi:hypothetical protein CHS0354_006633 [Potamilus streckersoni]|uniref:Cytokine-like nuclear factor N-PAC n=1 Tax=Potamilus streckersoni TaxID=2493646 RepID=A0AAE0W398_9BIVA|nr:hypothetical protein CHS0354_006633 [Potamilus streckersoni]
MASKFEIGDLVWAKMKGFPAWPGKVIEPKDELKTPMKKKNHHFIFFFGSENYAWIPEDSIFHYMSNKERFMLTTRVPRGFKEAIEAMEDAVKALPEQSQIRMQDLPSIDEELAQIFPNKSFSAPARKPKETPVKKEGETKPTKPKIKRDSFLRKTPMKRPSPLSPSQKIVKKARAVAKVAASPSMFHHKSPVHSTPIRSPDKPNEEELVSATKIKSRIIPELKVSEGEVTNDDMPVTSAATQIEESLLIKPVMKSVIPTPSRIGFLGLGIMGQGMVMNLLRSGHEVTVWNRTILKCREFVKAGALKGNSPAEVVQSCDITFSCVSDSSAVKDLVFGNAGVLQGISPGKCYVEMSTIDEDTVQDAAEAITARGGVFLEAPVVGSRVPALEGQLVILAAGDRKLYDDCYSCFEALGKKSLYLGSDVGAAMRMKLIINMIMGTVMASLAEGMAMAEKVGLDQEDIAEVLSLGSLSCPTVIHKSQAILNQKYDPHFPLQHQQKDLRLALQLGDKVEQPLYVAAAANELYKKARRLGYGESDISAVFRAASA